MNVTSKSSGSKRMITSKDFISDKQQHVCVWSIRVETIAKKFTRNR